MSFFFGVKFLFFTTTAESVLVGEITPPEGSVLTEEVTVVLSGVCLLLQLYNRKSERVNNAILNIPFFFTLLFKNATKNYVNSFFLYFVNSF